MIIELGTGFALDGSSSTFAGDGFDPSQLRVEWILHGDTDVLLATGLGLPSLITGNLRTGPGTPFDHVGDYDILLRLTFGTLVSEDSKLLTIFSTPVPEPGTFALASLALLTLLATRRRR